MAAVVETKYPSLGLLASGPEDAAETLVFLHGWGGSRELWRHTLQTLPQFRCLALDLPGTGGTSLPPGLSTMPQMAAWVFETCATLGLTQITLVGHSLGGNLAAQTALDYPVLVQRLVLVDAALNPAHLPVRARWPLHRRWGLPALKLLRWGALAVAPWGRRVSAAEAAQFWRGQTRRSHWYVAANPDDRRLQCQLQALTDNPLLPERLAALPMPVLILHGAYDPVVPVSSARALAEFLPAARLHIFPTSLHCPMDTDANGFALAITEFAQSSHLDAPAGACYNERQTPDPT